MAHELVLPFKPYKCTPLTDICPEDKWEVQDWELPNTNLKGDAKTYFQVWEDLYAVSCPDGANRDHFRGQESVRILNELSEQVFLRTGYPAERLHAILEVKHRTQS